MRTSLQQGFGESEGRRDGIHDDAVAGKPICEGFIGGFADVSKELACVMPCSIWRRVILGSRILREIHWSAVLLSGVFSWSTPRSHTARSGQVPHSPGGTKVFVGPDHCGSHTARSGQAPHTPGGTEVASVDVGTLRRHHGFCV